MNWNELREEVKSLASKIDYTPDVIIGIVRGGLIPARLLSSELRVKDMYAITVKKVGDERRVMNDILEELSAKNVLLVAKEYLEEKGARIKTACLYTMPISELRPDFWLKEVSEVVPFPWE